MLALRAGLFGVAMIGLIGCAPTGSFECQADAQCSGGQCEPNGWCSFPDEDCDSRMRYGALVGDGLAGICVPVDETGTGSDPTTGGASPLTDTSPATEGDASGPAPDPATSAPPASVGDVLDGDGCDADCAPSGETVWQYVYGGEGFDVARDVVLLEDGTVAVCGDATFDTVQTPFYVLLSETGDPIVEHALDVGVGSAWGIAAYEIEDALIIGGELVASGDEGFVVGLLADGTVLDTFTVAQSVFDIAASDGVIYAGGRLGSAAFVGGYDPHGIEVDIVSGLPTVGVVWDIVVSADGWIHVAAANGITDEAWIGGQTPAPESSSWATGWSTKGSGAAYGIGRTTDDAVVASGNVAESGIVTVLDVESGAERWSSTLSASRGRFANIHKAVGGPAGEVVGIGWVATSDSDAEIWVGKYSSEGELLWERTFAGVASGGNGWGVAIDEAGYITAVGGLAGVATDYDFWVIRLEP